MDCGMNGGGGMRQERKGMMRGYKKLVESLQEKSSAEWSDTFLVKESNEIYKTAADREQIQSSNYPPIH
jgi:hypothetical protein